MTGLVTICDPHGQPLQRFVRTRGQPQRPKQHRLKQLWVDSKPSTVGPSCQDGEIIKLIKARRWHEHIKILWAHSRTHKEVVGADLLQQLGLNTPAIHEMGISLPIFPQSRYIGYYVMDNLLSQGLQEVHQLFEEPNTPESLRLTIIDNICAGLQAMYRNKIVFTDFHLANVFCNSDGDLTWIDTGITVYHIRNKREQKYTASIQRLVNYYDDGMFTEQEKQRLLQCLAIA